MKRIFTKSTALKLIVLLAVWGCMGNKALAQAACTITSEAWEVLEESASGYLGTKDITIGTTTFTFPVNGNVTNTSNTTTVDLTNSVSFAITAGTGTPITVDLLEEGGFAMYIDWDKDGNFNIIKNSSNPAGEYIDGASFSLACCTPTSATYTGNINVPAFIPSGNYRARLIEGYFGGTTVPTSIQQHPCGDYTTGAIYNLGVPYGEIATFDVQIVLTNNSNCFPPQPPTVSAVTANGATIAWNPPSDVNSGYQWALVANGEPVNATPVAAGTTVAGVNGVNIPSGLTPNTTYNFYVRAGCGFNDSSLWVGPLAVTTLAPQCVKTPAIPSISNPPLSTGVCASFGTVLNGTHVNDTVSGVTYQWLQSSTGAPGSFTSVTGGSGASTLSYSTAPYPVNAQGMQGNFYYEIVATCNDAGNVFTALPSAPYHVITQSSAIPYYQDFTTTPTGSLPQCYENDPSDPTGSFNVQGNFIAADGTPLTAIVAKFPPINAQGNRKNSFFTLPPLVLGNNTYTIQFNYARSNTNYRQRLQVYANTTDPGTMAFPGGSNVIGNGIKVIDIIDTATNVQLAKYTFTPPTPGTYYFSWYDSSLEVASPPNGTAQGVGNIAIYIAQPCVRPTAQPTALTFSSNVSTITGSFTPPSPAPDKYLVVRTLGTTPLLNFTPADGTNYSVNDIAGNGTVVYVGKYTTYTDLYLSSGAQYTYTIYAFNDLCSSGPLYDFTTPVTGTYQTTGGNTYTWNQTIAGDYQVATNWTPSRIVPDPSDVLIFSNGVNDTVNNVPVQAYTNQGAASQVSVINNTNVRIRAGSATATMLLLATSANTNVLTINANSSLILDGSSAGLTLAFGGAGATATINGTLEVQNNGPTNVVNFTNCIATVSATGTLAAGGSVGSSTTPGISFSAPANLTINGTYNHKYTIVAGGNIPLATWGTGSTVLISGYTTNTSYPGNLNNQVFYNFTYNCPNQTANVAWNGAMTANTTFNALGTFTMASTGTASLQLGSTSYYIYNTNNYVQTGGTLDLGSSAPSTLYQQSFNVSGSFSQTGGLLKASSTSTTIGQTLNFNGTNGPQSVSFFNAAPTGPVVYRISNFNGINLTGTGTLTSGSVFNLNSGGGIRINTTSANPINTSFVLTYANTGTAGGILTFDTSANLTATASVWPASGGPFSVTVFAGQGHAVTVPFTRTIPGNLTFTSGDLDFGANSLTIGQSAAAPGSIQGVNGTGFVRLTTGSLTRWFPTASLPSGNGQAALNLNYTSTTAGIGYFPVSYGPANRNVFTYFSSATALSNGGTITVSHTSLPGLVAVGSITDGTYTIQSRTAASWTFATGNGIALAGGAAMGVRITPSLLFAPLNSGNLHLLRVNTAAPGTHVAGGGATPLVYAERTGLALSDLTSGNWYAGAANADISGANIWTAINTGNWNTGSTWDQGTVPGTGIPAATAICIINPKVVVSVNAAATNTVKVVTNNGSLNITGGSLTVDSAFYNNDTVNATGGTLAVNGNGNAANLAVGITTGGVFNVAGGTINLGPTGGGNKPFTSNGVLNVSSGTLNINGNLLVNGATTTTPFVMQNSVFMQSGGNINVDGNAAGNTAASVVSPTAIVSFRTPNLSLTGGTLTIVDPHASTSTTPNTFEYNVTTTNAPFYNYNVPVTNLATAHTIIFGDGVSTTGGGSSNGFKINPVASSGQFHFGNVIVNGAAGTNRFVLISTTMGILGNLTVNTAGEFRSSSTLFLKNNLTVNTGGTFTSSSTLVFTDYSNAGSPYQPASPTQTVSGSGTFRNSATAPTANFASLALCGGSNPTFLDSLSFSGTINFSASYPYPSSGGSLLSHIIVPNISNYRVVESSTSSAPTNASATVGWVVGAYQKHANTGTISSTFIFPVGDMQYYTPVQLAGTTSSTAAVTTGGDIYARVTQGLEPNLVASTLNPLKTVKRYATLGIPTGNPIAFANGSVTATVNWSSADLPVGANTNVFSVGLDPIPAGSNTPTGVWSYPATAFKLPTSIQATGLVPSFMGNYAIGEICPPSSISTQPSGSAICSGIPDTISVVATGLGLTYQWYLNNSGTAQAITGATNATYIIPNPGQADSGAYYVIVGGLCAAPITSSTISLTITSAPVITSAPAASSVCEGSADTLTVASSGTPPFSYQWLKNNVAIAGATNSSYIIPAATLGDAAGYTVAVTNSCATVTSAQAAVVVNPLPLATVTALGSTTACAGSSVTLQAPTGNAAYSWVINGVPSGFNSRFDTVSTSGGVQVTVTSLAGCNATSIADTVTFIAAPPATITTLTNSIFCLPGNVVLYADTLTGYTYNWLRDGNPIRATGAYYSADVSGSYQVVVKNSFNCPDTSIAQVVAANPVPAPVVASVGGAPTTFCQNSSVMLTTPISTYATYNWYDLNTNVAIATTQTTAAIFASGSYELMVTDGNGCAGASAPIIVTVNPLPTATAVAQGPTTICPGGSVVLAGGSGIDPNVTFRWYNGTFPIVPAATGSTYTATNNGSYKLEVTETATGCVGTSAPVINVVLNPPIATITPAGNQTLCQGTTTTLTANTGASYQWYLNGTTPLTSTQMLTVSAAGTYTVAVTNVTGCSAISAGKTITMVAAPVAVATAGGATTFCAGSSVVLSADTGTGLTYLWSPGNQTTRVINATASGLYTVAVKNSNNCSSVSNSINVTSVPYPVVTLTASGSPTSICAGSNVLLTAGPVGNSYLWSLNGTPLPFSDLNRNSMSYPATQTGTYTVTVTNSTGCAGTTPPADAISVFVNPVPHVQTLGPTEFCWGSNDVLSVNAGTGTGLAYQWYNEAGPIPGADSATYHVYDSGVYYAVVTVIGSCAQATPDSVKITVDDLPLPVIAGSANSNTITSSGSYSHYQWYLGNAPIPGDTLGSVTVYVNGDYHLVVTSNMGCTGVSNIYHKGDSTSTGVASVTKDDINIYPNPVSSIVHIDASIPVDATISTIDGRAAMQQSNAKAMDLTGLANGVYMIRVYDKAGTLLKVDKLVKASND